MRLFVLAALAAVVLADVSDLPSYNYNAPASSYGVPQSSVTERQFNALPTSPSPGLNLPTFEHQDFNALNSLPGAVISTTAAPFTDSGLVSSTPAPNVATDLLVSSTPAPSIIGSGLNLNAQFPSFGAGLSYSTPAPSLSFTSDFGLLSGQGLGGFVSSTPAPSVEATSGSQESLNLNAQFPNFNFNAGLGAFSTPAPDLFSSTLAPTISTLAPGLGFNSGLGLGGQYGFPGLGLGGFSTSAPITLGSGGLTSIDSNLFNSDAALNSANIHGITSGGSLTDAFGVSSSGTVSAGTLPIPQQVSKHLYFYSAPEDPEPARTRINVAPVPPPKKNVKVIFIKAPAPPAPAPISIAAPPQDEEKTIVYVLVKKPEETQNIEIQTQPPSPPPKPEVYFIKYKTPQEAEQAIAEVQNSASADGSVASLPSLNGGALINTVSSTPLPIPNFASTTPFPLLNFGNFGGISGPVLDGGYQFNQNLFEPDISQNLISSGAQTSSLFSTASPLISSVPTGDSGFLGSTTLSPLPHVTYGPPVYKKK